MILDDKRSHQFVLPLSHDALCSVAVKALCAIVFVLCFVKTSVVWLQFCVQSNEASFLCFIVLNIMCLGIKKHFYNVTRLVHFEPEDGALELQMTKSTNSKYKISSTLFLR